MPKYPYQTIGVELDVENLQKLNKNFSDIETDFRNISNDVFFELLSNAKLIWKGPVDSQGDLVTAYPDPEVGWVAMARDTGDVYRFDGSAWVVIQEVDAGPVNELETRMNEKMEKYVYAGNSTVALAGVIKRTGSQWSILNDANNADINLTNVAETVNNEVEVTHGSASKVGALNVTAGINYASLGIDIGVETGVQSSKIKFYAPFVGRIKNGGSTLSVSSLFNNAATSVRSADGTKITVTYDGVGNALDKAIVIPSLDATTQHVGMTYIARRINANQVEVTGYYPFYAKISYSGSDVTFNIETSCKMNISVAWNSAIGKEGIIITHDAITNVADNLQLIDIIATSAVGAGSQSYPVVESVTPTQTKITLRHGNGGRMELPEFVKPFYVTRPNVLVPHVIPTTAILDFDFGRAQVRPNQLGDGTLQILGIHNA